MVLFKRNSIREVWCGKTLFDHPSPFLISAGYRAPDYLPRTQVTEVRLWCVMCDYGNHWGSSGDPDFHNSIPHPCHWPWHVLALTHICLRVFLSYFVWGLCYSYCLPSLVWKGTAWVSNRGTCFVCSNLKENPLYWCTPMCPNILTSWLSLSVP